MLFRRIFSALAFLLTLGASGFRLSAAAEEEEPLEIKAVAGLRYDPPRFVVKPGAKVKLNVENTDDMAHNFVVVAPGGRMEVVTAAMALPITPEQTFIPQSDKILFHTPVLIPGKSATLEFTAPEAEGVYPYVCTYPGHGLVMFGAMYVTKKQETDLVPLASDDNLPDLVRDQAKSQKLHAFPAEPPYWYRIFLRDSGPASIAVALLGGQNYCWDAGACRLRYLWHGAFVDPTPHWRANGDGFAEVLGTIYYRSAPYFPLRFGDEKKVPAEVQFRGYAIVNGVPEFHYLVDGVDVHELITAARNGGVDATFKISGARSSIFYLSDPNSGATLTSEAGKFTDGVLKLPAKTKQFTVTFTEILHKEPIGYWSMNDVLLDKKPRPVAGVKGRALVFDGKKSRFPTGLKTDALAEGGTFCIWAQMSNPPAPDQACIGAVDDSGEFMLGANLAGIPGYGVLVRNATQEAKIVAAMPAEADSNWHYLAATLDKKALRFFFDGKPAGRSMPAALPAAAEFFLGSSGNKHFAAATLDEARIYARVLDDKEIAALYENERPSATQAQAAPAPIAHGRHSTKPAP